MGIRAVGHIGCNIAATVEDAFAHAGYAARYNNVGQAGAIVKSIFVNAGYATRYDNAFQAAAPGKRSVANAGHAIGNDNIGQAAAHGERTRANVVYSVRYGNTGQACTTVECIVSNTGHTDRYVIADQADAVVKRHFFNDSIARLNGSRDRCSCWCGRGCLRGFRCRRRCGRSCRGYGSTGVLAHIEAVAVHKLFTAEGVGLSAVFKAILNGQFIHIGTVTVAFAHALEGHAFRYVHAVAAPLGNGIVRGEGAQRCIGRNDYLGKV